MKATKSDAEKKAAVLVKEETRKKGRVGLDVYRRYLSSGAGECAISLLGNLLTDEFDSEALESLALFTAAGGLERMMVYVALLVNFLIVAADVAAHPANQGEGGAGLFREEIELGVQDHADDVEEIIMTKWEDDVQSVDIQSMSKV